jgi:hypothetical protein
MTPKSDRPAATHRFEGTHWDLFAVNHEKRTAWVINGDWELHWDETDFYARVHEKYDNKGWHARVIGFLEWIGERNGSQLLEVGTTQ